MGKHVSTVRSITSEQMELIAQARANSHLGSECGAISKRGTTICARREHKDAHNGYMSVSGNLNVWGRHRG